MTIAVDWDVKNQTKQTNSTVLYGIKLAQKYRGTVNVLKFDH